MATGTVKWFNLDKGFGFLTNDEGGGDVFVHFTNIDSPNSRNLLEGQPVEFELGEGQKGPQALHVNAVGDPPADYVSSSYAPRPPARNYGPSKSKPRRGYSTGDGNHRR